MMLHWNTIYNIFPRAMVALAVLVSCLIAPACASIRTNQMDCCGGEQQPWLALQAETSSHQAPCCVIKDKAASGAAILGTHTPINFEPFVAATLSDTPWDNHLADVVPKECSILDHAYLPDEQKRYLRLRVLLN